MKKFIIILAFTVVFFAVSIRADSDEDSEEYDEEEHGFDASLFASAMQLNNNNVGDIHNVKGIINFCLAIR
jgi:hypothetical protein